MQISLTGAPEYQDRYVGYGEASYNIINQLEKKGIECLIGAAKPKISIAFIQPPQYMFLKNQYKIGYTPWESTDVPEDWIYPLNNKIDELWTTSPWCVDMFKKHTDKPVFLYEHGVQDTWIPRKRSINKSRPFRFLHVGEPAFRKDGQIVLDAFISLYGNNPNYELILKCSRMNTAKVFDKVTGEVLGSPDAIYKNVKIIESMLSVEQMDGLFDLCDVFVYPSWGEGFGFNPLQAMAKGIPTICTSAWASYARYITMPLDSKQVNSPWQVTHPGKMYKPNYAELKFYMSDVIKNYDSYANIAYRNSFLIHKDYNWTKVSKPAIQRLKEIEKSYF